MSLPLAHNCISRLQSGSTQLVEPSHSGLSQGAVAGIATVGVAILLGLLFLAYFYRRYMCHKIAKDYHRLN
jgi:hypothetical protein